MYTPHRKHLVAGYLLLITNLIISSPSWSSKFLEQFLYASSSLLTMCHIIISKILCVFQSQVFLFYFLSPLILYLYHTISITPNLTQRDTWMLCKLIEYFIHIYACYWHPMAPSHSTLYIVGIPWANCIPMQRYLREILHTRNVVKLCSE